MEITKKDVELTGKLAKMRVSEQEAAIYEEQLQALFAWVKDLSAVNTDGVEISDFSSSAPLRADSPVENPALAQTLVDAFNEQKDRCAQVKKVL